MTTGMRVCLVTPYSPREISGVGQVVLNLGKGLRERKHDVMVLTKFSRNGPSGTPGLVEIDYREVRLVGGLLLSIGMIWRMLRERKRIDIVHLHSISSVTLACAVIGSILGKPRVLTLHGRFPRPKSSVSSMWFGLKERMTLAFSKAVTCVSKDTKDFYRLDNAHVVWNGIDTSRFVPDLESRKTTRERLGLGDSFTLLFVGRWVAHKGIYDTIQLTGDLIHKGEDVRLILVGSGEDEKVRRSIDETSIGSRVVIAGRVEDVVPCFQSSDMFILFTSPLEGLPLTLLEAMACQLPCVATSVSGIQEAISDGIDGFLVKEGDFPGLKKVVVEFIEKQENYQNIGVNARKKVENRFDIAKMTRAYLDIYASILRAQSTVQ